MGRNKWAGIVMLAAIVFAATGCPIVPGYGQSQLYLYQPLVAAGAHHTCAQRVVNDQDGTAVSCWGDNSSGQLGNGTTTASATPVVIAGLRNVNGMVAAGNRTCVLVGANNAVKCWGDNSNGAIGDGTTTDRSVPTQIPGLNVVTSIAMSDTFTCAGEDTPGVQGVVCWGRVPGLPGITASPTHIPGMDGADDHVTVGDHHVCAVAEPLVASSGHVWCFGDNSSGQLGDGTTTSSVAPVEITSLSALLPPITTSPGASPLTLVAAGDHTCADIFNPAHTTWCWGDNSSGQFADGTTTGSLTPEVIPQLTLPSFPPSIVSSGLLRAATYTCMGVNVATATPIHQFGCLGDNSSGQLGDGTNVSRLDFVADALAPGTFADGNSLRASLGPTHACTFVAGPDAFTPPLLCWGDNSSGQLGDGTTTSSNTPVTVLGG
jgi:alpha-tubulin suppressor-like RCC1 family protein